MLKTPRTTRRLGSDCKTEKVQLEAVWKSAKRSRDSKSKYASFSNRKLPWTVPTKSSNARINTGRISSRKHQTSPRQSFRFPSAVSPVRTRTLTVASRSSPSRTSTTRTPIWVSRCRVTLATASVRSLINSTEWTGCSTRIGAMNLTQRPTRRTSQASTGCWEWTDRTQ